MLGAPRDSDQAGGLEAHLTLLRAALSKIDPGYFMLATTYEPSGIVRERVFCYEFYHQARTLMGDDYPLSLNGEIDKRGHIDFAMQDRKNPDFVFHIPGTHAGNTIAIEAKGRLDRPGEIIADILTVRAFVQKYGYQAGLFILYNHSIQELRDTLSDRLSPLAEEPCASRIFLMAIPESGAQVQQITLAECQ